jgi:hypothetical protein
MTIQIPYESHSPISFEQYSPISQSLELAQADPILPKQGCIRVIETPAEEAKQGLE